MVEYSEALMRALSAFLILIIGLILAHVLSNILRRFLKGVGLNKILEEQLKIKFALEKHISNILKYLIYFITIILVLDKLGISTKILQIILLILVLIIVILIILAFKDWLPNMAAGFYILRTNKIKPKDIIKVKGIKGKVVEVNLLETKIETNNNELIFIPNSNIAKYEVIKEKK